jgi:hypothetical protein
MSRQQTSQPRAPVDVAGFGALSAGKSLEAPFGAREIFAVIGTIQVAVTGFSGR